MLQAISVGLWGIIDIAALLWAASSVICFAFGLAKRGPAYGFTLAACWPFWIVGVLMDLRHQDDEPREISSGWVDGYGWSVYEPISPLAQRVIIGGLESEWKAHDAARKMRRGET